MDRAFLHLVRGSCHPERDHRFREGFPRYLPSNPPPAPPASLQSTYGHPLSATGTRKEADDEACKSNDFNAVAAVADKSRKIRGKPRLHPCRSLLSTREIHHRNETRQPGNCFEERSASTATGATGRPVATRFTPLSQVNARALPRHPDSHKETIHE